MKVSRVLIALVATLGLVAGFAPSGAQADDRNWVQAAENAILGKDMTKTDQVTAATAELAALVDQAGNDTEALYNILYGVDWQLGPPLALSMQGAKDVYRATEEVAADVFFDGSCYHGVVTDSCWRKTVSGVYSWEIRALGNDAALVKVNGFGFLWTRPGSTAYTTDDYALGYKRFAWSTGNDALTEPGSSAIMTLTGLGSLPTSVKVGGTITVNPTFSVVPNIFSYWWSVCSGSNKVRKIVTTSPTYTTTAADAGCGIDVLAYGSKAGYAPAGEWASNTMNGRLIQVGTGSTNPTDPSTKSFKTALSKISGAAKVGKVLKATSNASKWSPHPTSVKYQWKRNGVEIAGATKSSYKLVAADYKAKITVKVTGSKSGYTSASRTSKSTKAVALGTMSKGKVKVTGTSKVGKTLTAKTTRWTKGVTFTYRWYRNGKIIASASAKTYVLAAADRGKRIKVKVTAVKAGYKSTSSTSKATGKTT